MINKYARQVYVFDGIWYRWVPTEWLIENGDLEFDYITSEEDSEDD